MNLITLEGTPEDLAAELLRMRYSGDYTTISVLTVSAAEDGKQLIRLGVE
jgi:hypothetical protein